MLHPARVPVWIASSLLTTALLLGAQPAAAQQLPAGEVPQRFENAVRKIDLIIRDMLKGEKKPDEPANQEAVDLKAKWYAFRVTWAENQTTAGNMNGLVDGFDRDLQSYIKARAVNPTFVDLFVKQFVTHSGEVLKNDKAIARVNGARLLHVLAKAGFEEAAEPLVEAIKDKDQNDGVRYWAFQGLREVLALSSQNPPVKFKKPEREFQAVAALLEFIDRKVAIRPGTPPDEVAGIRRLRKEAVKALAQSRSPVLLDDKKAVKGQTALVLLKVMRKDVGIFPTPQWDEQVEAAIGLARMQCKLSDNYNPDYVAYHIGQFVVEWIVQYEADKTSERGWKVHAARLNDALNGYGGLRSDVAKNRSKDAAVVALVDEVCKRCLPKLQGMENKANVNPADLGNWLSSASPSDRVYKDMPDSKVKLPEPAGE